MTYQQSASQQPASQQPTNALPNNTQTLGETINAWDQFYRNHFKWVYGQALGICQNTIVAKKLTDKLFAKVLLSNPNYVVEDNIQAIRSELGLMFPYHGIAANTKKELSAGRLLSLYYQPN